MQRACELLDEADLTVNMHAMGTNVEGELYSVLLAVQKLHLTLHTDGVERVSSRMTIETRSDKVPELDDRVEA